METRLAWDKLRGFHSYSDVRRSYSRPTADNTPRFKPMNNKPKEYRECGSME